VKATSVPPPPAWPQVSLHPAPRPWLLWAYPAFLPHHSLAQEPPWATTGYARPLGSLCPNHHMFLSNLCCSRGSGTTRKGLENQPGRFFKQKSVISLRGGRKRGKKYPPRSFLAPTASIPVHLVVWQLWAYFKICCPGRETKEAGTGPGETSEDRGIHLVKNNPPHCYFY
jgi:hypothetical protein